MDGEPVAVCPCPAQGGVHMSSLSRLPIPLPQGARMTFINCAPSQVSKFRLANMGKTSIQVPLLTRKIKS